jgi:NADPH-dependent curcumin reductase CurA
MNRQFRLAARPVGLPKAGDWKLTEEPVPEPRDGEALVQIELISLDPAMRGCSSTRSPTAAGFARWT